MKHLGRNKILKYYIIYILLVIFSCSTKNYESNTNSKDHKIDWHYSEKIISDIIIPEFPDTSVNITDYGAISDGTTICTEAIKNAIKECHNMGGGFVLIPKGVFLTGPVHLLSNVNLHLEKGAVLKFDTAKTSYLPLVHTRFEGMECMNYSPFIYAYEEENVAITGDGTLDGQGQVWWSWKGPWDGQMEIGWNKGKPNQLKAVARLLEMVEKDVPLEKRIFGDGWFLRPNFIQPYKCKNILIEGITVINSPMWIIHPVLSENITVRNVRVESLGPNNDGCNPESSKNIWIKNCYFNNGDDCIAIKSGRNNDGRKFNIPCENIVIQDCVMKEGHGGIVIGSEMSGNVKNVFTENCIMDSPHLDRALRIKSNSVRGGIVENIFFRNTDVKEVKEAIVKINMFYDRDRSDYIPTVKNINIENIISHKSDYSIWIKAYKEKPVEGLIISNCTFNDVRKGMYLHNVTGMKIDNVNYYSFE